MKNYKELLKLIKEYEKTEIWKDISGDDIFEITGYQTPIFVSLLGQAGIIKEINIYVGENELYDQYDITYGEYQKHPDGPFRVSCYKLVVEDAEDLFSNEAKEIARKNRLPKDKAIFRLQKGCPIKLISEEEAKSLIPIMKDLLKIVDYLKKNPVKFPEQAKIDEKYAFTVRGDEVTYEKKVYPSGHLIRVESNKIDEEILNKVLIFSQKGTFGVGLFYGPFYNQEEQKYSLLLMIMDLDSGNLLDAQAIAHKDLDDVPNYLLSAFLKLQRYPEKIAFTSTDCFLRCQYLIPELKMDYKIDTEMTPLFDAWLKLRDFLEIKNNQGRN